MYRLIKTQQPSRKAEPEPCLIKSMKRPALYRAYTEMNSAFQHTLCTPTITVHYWQIWKLRPGFILRKGVSGNQSSKGEYQKMSKQSRII
jgi:hypothetical protein